MEQQRTELRANFFWNGKLWYLTTCFDHSYATFALVAKPYDLFEYRGPFSLGVHLCKFWHAGRRSRFDVLFSALPDYQRPHLAGGAGGNRVDDIRNRQAALSYKRANSPDLNPIEGMWALLQRAVSPPGTTKQSEATLRRKVREWFAKRHKETCRKALRGMRARCDELEHVDFDCTSH